MTSRPGRLVLLGHPVAHTLSPLFQNAALRAAGIPLAYEALDVPPERLDETLELLRGANAAGNATIPHKAALAARCARRTELAERAGAVNTFWFERGVLVGDNTDVGGFARAAELLVGAAPHDITVGVLGAGGAAAAVLAAVERWPGARALVWNRSPARADALSARFSSVARRGDVAEIGRSAELVVNATAIGLHDDAFPFDPAQLRADAAALDLVYRRGETAWVRAVRATGRRAADGVGMLVEQGALAFERWFGLSPDRAAMMRALASD